MSSYIGFIKNPFCQYTIDLDGIGNVVIDSGILSKSESAYDLFPISDATANATLGQRLFGLGNVTFQVRDFDDKTHNIILRNIRCAKDVAAMLRKHRIGLISSHFDSASYLHLI